MKKKVLLACNGNLDKTGVPSVIMTIVRNLHEEYDFDLILSSNKPSYYTEEFKSYGGRLIELPKHTSRIHLVNRILEVLRPVSLALKTKKIIQKEHYDILHCHNDFDMAGCVYSARKMIPIRICHTHKTWNPKGNILTKAYRYICRSVMKTYATDLIGCSGLACQTTYGNDATFKVINNPYDDTRFIYQEKTFDHIELLQIGYFCENKNQLFSLDVFNQILSQEPDAKLHFIGNSENTYGNYIKTKVSSNIQIHPENTDVPEIMKQCNVLLFPSKVEGFGIVLIEAQAIGLRCYASDHIPKETNVGGVTYLPLQASQWADRILHDNLARYPYDCNPFHTTYFISHIQELYIQVHH